MMTCGTIPCWRPSWARTIPPASTARKRDQGKALAGKSTLNRLELTPVGADEDSRYKKIICVIHAVSKSFRRVCSFRPTQQPPEQIVLDLDATDDPIHGDQLGRFFHGYYKEYCYLPLYIFCGDHLLCARLRPSDIDGSAGALEATPADHRPDPPGLAPGEDRRFVVTADSAVSRPWLGARPTAWTTSSVWPKNSRLLKLIAEPSEQARQAVPGDQATGPRVRGPALSRPWTSWSRERRVVAKAEHLDKGANPRFVVTSSGVEEHRRQGLL